MRYRKENLLLKFSFLLYNHFDKEWLYYETNRNNSKSEQKINLDCSDLEKAKDLFKHLEFEELIRVKYKVTVYSKDKVEYAFQDVENLGVLIEYENMNDFEGKSLDEINSVKNNMFEEIKNTGINLTEEKDVKKAYELILNKYFNKWKNEEPKWTIPPKA